jgi:glutaredoxin
MPADVITLYGRPGCHLCDEARVAIDGLRREGAAFELREVDIETDPELHRSLLELIPVVELNGDRVSELVLDADLLRSRLGTFAE